jgi:hypothetical protein
LKKCYSNTFSVLLAFCAVNTLHRRSYFTLCNTKLISIVFKYSVPTSKKTKKVSITKTNCLILLMEVIDVYSENHKKPVNTYCRQNSELFNFKVRGHRAYLTITKTRKGRPRSDPGFSDTDDDDESRRYISPQGPTIVGTGSGTPEVPELPSARGYSCVTLSPGVINTENWSSRLGVGRGVNNPHHKKLLLGNLIEEAKARYGL